MIKYNWNGPYTAIKNRLLIQGRQIELDPKDPQTKTWEALGYLQPENEQIDRSQAINERPEDEKETGNDNENEDEGRFNPEKHTEEIQSTQPTQGNLNAGLGSAVVESSGWIGQPEELTTANPQSPDPEPRRRQK